MADYGALAIGYDLTNDDKPPKQPWAFGQND